MGKLEISKGEGGAEAKKESLYKEKTNKEKQRNGNEKSQVYCRILALSPNFIPPTHQDLFCITVVHLATSARNNVSLIS